MRIYFFIDIFPSVPHDLISGHPVSLCFDHQRITGMTAVMWCMWRGDPTAGQGFPEVVPVLTFAYVSAAIVVDQALKAWVIPSLYKTIDFGMDRHGPIPAASCF